jgi:hypothetical protein
MIYILGSDCAELGNRDRGFLFYVLTLLHSFCSIYPLESESSELLCRPLPTLRRFRSVV